MFKNHYVLNILVNRKKQYEIRQLTLQKLNKQLQEFVEYEQLNFRRIMK